MHKRAKFLIAGVAAVACAGAVVAASHDVHVMKVALPDGSVAQIHYSGDVAPKIEIAPTAQGQMPVAMIAAGDPFAEMDRMMAAMDAQSDAMMQRAALAAAQAPAASQMVQTAAGGASGSSYHYTYVSTSDGGSGACTQSYELTSYGDKQQPRVVSQQSGDCKGVPALTPAVAPAPPVSAKPAVTPTAAEKPAHPVTVSKDALII